MASSGWAVEVTMVQFCTAAAALADAEVCADIYIIRP